MELSRCLAVVVIAAGFWNGCSRQCGQRTAPSPHGIAHSCASVPPAGSAASAESGEGMSNLVELYAASLERDRYSSFPVGISGKGRMDPRAVTTCVKYLESGSDDVYEGLVRFLVELGQSHDSSGVGGGNAICDPDIVAALLRFGLSRQGASRDDAMVALRQSCSEQELRCHGDLITQNLERNPSQEAFLLVAKAKPPQAQRVVGLLSQQKRWEDKEAARIARAALGDCGLQDDFIDAADAAEGDDLVKALHTLSLIGTTRTLVALAEYLRSPVTVGVKGAFEKSIRMEVLAALAYAFPSEPTLNPNAIIRDSDYEAAEQFCARTLGVKYTGPRPPFLTIRGYPSGVSP